MALYVCAFILIGAVMWPGSAAGGNDSVAVASSAGGASGADVVRECTDGTEAELLRYTETKRNVRNCIRSLINGTVAAGALCHEKSYSGCGSLDDLMVSVHELNAAGVDCGVLHHHAARTRLLFLSYWAPSMLGYLKLQDVRAVSSLREKIRNCDNDSSIDASFEGGLLATQQLVNVLSCNQSNAIENCVSSVLREHPDTVRYVHRIFSVVRRFIGCNDLPSPSETDETWDQSVSTYRASTIGLAVCAVVAVAALAALIAYSRLRRPRVLEPYVHYSNFVTGQLNENIK